MSREIILEKFVPADWSDIEEVEPDDIDLQMLADIDADPDCHEFTDENDIDWESDDLKN
ncbi:MAG: hypothetical protein NC094_00970 [Bacteroidales bacterium]|nr:hypothetical protein [Lachnoclostridium sp.]MCM1382981.1 hypothetical protein [Lachnoclostridium sp.]MCM1463965.1 hypothetical protein [Bacteroidales bacterium]